MDNYLACLADVIQRLEGLKEYSSDKVPPSCVKFSFESIDTTALMAGELGKLLNALEASTGTKLRLMEAWDLWVKALELRNKKYFNYLDPQFGDLYLEGVLNLFDTLSAYQNGWNVCKGPQVLRVWEIICLLKKLRCDKSFKAGERTTLKDHIAELTRQMALAPNGKELELVKKGLFERFPEQERVYMKWVRYLETAMD